MGKTGFIILLFLALISNSLRASYDVMFSNHYPPYNFLNEEGELIGFNVDILNAIKDLYASDIKIKSGNWESINKALENQEIHAVAGTHYPGGVDNTYIYTRSAINTFHCFLYNSKYQANLTLERFRSLNSPLVAMWNNDVLMYYVRSINPTVRFLFINDYEQLVKSLDRKDVSCMFAQRVVGMYYAHKSDMNYIRSLQHQILERNMGFKVSRDTPELAELLNNGLEVILANGEYQRIYDKWITQYDNPENIWRLYLKYILIVAAIILVLLFILIVLTRVLKSRIKSKTEDLQKQLELNSEMMKELERQKLRAEESDRMKSAFLANMSHEIRTPMNGILGFTELLRTVDCSSDEQEQFIDIIEQSGNRMLGTINNIIDVSKLESGLESPQFKQVNIKGILDELKDFFAPEISSIGLEYILEEKGNSLTQNFYTDEYKLNSILTNLIKNAIKFTKEGRICVQYAITMYYAEFWVSDTGIGIPEDKQQAIFEQFVQADISHSSGFEGSGLGLSITSGYVKLLDGEIKLTSNKQDGTTFYVRIPNHNPAD